MHRIFGTALTALAFLILGAPTPAGAVGTLENVLATEVKSVSTALFTATGRLSLSVDGGGSLNATQTVQVQKPNGSARVRRAFLLAASTGQRGYVIPDGTSGVSLNGTGIVWDDAVPSAIGSWNHWADVTSLVKPVVDSSPAGRISFSIAEGSSSLIDGVVLAVVFDDSVQTQDSTVALFFGAQNTTGDRFSVSLAQPIQPNAPGALFTMGLGISFGAQSCAVNNQYSLVDVNGSRLTSSAGGEDDGTCADGALLTVGGLDDSVNNPSNPNGGHNGNPRTDDELYSLLPYINNSTQHVEIATSNPSNDDNIFFAYFQISGDVDISTGSCSPNATTLCLDDLPGDRRFKAEVSFATVQSGGLSGDGQAIPLDSLGVRRGGLFWFFSGDNPEMLVKVLNGCASTNHFWVFYSAGTNVGFTLTVTDTITNQIYESGNTDLHIAPPVADTNALPCN